MRTGYGVDGPYAHRAGYDMITGAGLVFNNEFKLKRPLLIVLTVSLLLSISAVTLVHVLFLTETEAGLLGLQGERGRGPVKAGIGITDLSTGLYIHGAILAALYARDHTGLGQKVDTSLFETQVALLTNVAMGWLNLGQEGQRWGAQHPNVVPYDAFKTKDLYIVCGAVNDKQFVQLCTLLGKPELASEERFQTNAARVKNREDLGVIINELFAEKTTDEWLERFADTTLPYGAINTMERVFSHPQTAAREMVTEIPYEAAKSGKYSLLGKLTRSTVWVHKLMPKQARL